MEGYVLQHWVKSNIFKHTTRQGSCLLLDGSLLHRNPPPSLHSVGACLVYEGASAMCEGVCGDFAWGCHLIRLFTLFGSISFFCFDPCLPNIDGECSSHWLLVHSTKQTNKKERNNNLFMRLTGTPIPIDRDKKLGSLLSNKYCASWWEKLFWVFMV